MPKFGLMALKKGSGKWSGTLVSGSYIFEARKTGCSPTSISKQITATSANQSYQLPAPVAIVGSVVITSNPAMADVAIDGKTVGRTPLDLSNVPVGEHTLTVSKAGYASKSIKITVAEGRTEGVYLTLKKITALAQSQIILKDKITSAPYKVGSYYNDGTKEGVVFEVSADGKHGKIVSLSYKRNKWINNAKEIDKSIGAKSKSDGHVNQARLESLGLWHYPAFRACANEGKDWYLPAINELKTLLAAYNKHRHTFSVKRGLSISGSYLWSSTESGSKRALYLDTYNNSIGTSNKIIDNQVCVVAKF